MEIKSINISQKTYGANKGEYEASISLKGGSSYPADINIGIPVEMLEPIVAIIQQAVVESMARSAEEFRQSVAASLNPPIEHEQLEGPTSHDVSL